MNGGNEFNMMFNAIDDDGRRFVLAVLREEFERTRNLSGPRLRLVWRTDPAPNLSENEVNPLPVGGAG